ncbi:hypothetical protein Dimus_035786 [Dionaea muscipula]
MSMAAIIRGDHCHIKTTADQQQNKSCTHQQEDKYNQKSKAYNSRNPWQLLPLQTQIRQHPYPKKTQSSRSLEQQKSRSKTRKPDTEQKSDGEQNQTRSPEPSSSSTNAELQTPHQSHHHQAGGERGHQTAAAARGRKLGMMSTARKRNTSRVLGSHIRQTEQSRNRRMTHHQSKKSTPTASSSTTKRTVPTDKHHQQAGRGNPPVTLEMEEPWLHRAAGEQAGVAATSRRSSQQKRQPGAGKQAKETKNNLEPSTPSKEKTSILELAAHRATRPSKTQARRSPARSKSNQKP